MINTVFLLPFEPYSMAFLCSIKQLHLPFPFHLWFCLLFLFLYLFLPRFNILAPNHDSPSTKLDISDNTYLSTTTTITKEYVDDVDIEDFRHKYPFLKALETENNKSDPCGGRYIYVYNLPPKFNEDLIQDCEHFIYTNMCRYVENNGFGRKLANSGWYNTDQFTLEPIFYHRMKQYECLTLDSSIAAAIFVPFYAGCDLFRHLWGYNNKVKDALSYELADWLKNTSELSVMGGKDHFLIVGRVTGDFRRMSGSWGNKLLLLPELKNMSALSIESNEFAIPYPTYFHPSNATQLIFWQDLVRKIKRELLFAFAGAPRPKDRNSIRTQIVNQCKDSKVCKLLHCAVGNDHKCHTPEKVMKLFQRSHFCLQPQGDTPTRKSTFDAILAGCIPVFFNPKSAYEQYTWHLPKNYSKYSVFISEDDIRHMNVSIEETLKKISPEIIEEMRQEVIELIPKIVYADPRSKSVTFKDAFDISVEAVIRRVTKLRRDILQWPQG